MDITAFKELLTNEGQRLYRDMPWRQNTSPYYILVSEIMLQQTQVDRVRPKFEQFIQLFPDIQALADAELANVIRAWQGLGYNRRAKYLHDAAKYIQSFCAGVFPQATDELMKLPGVGTNTAGAIAAYSFNAPVVFVETNIRTVFVHHFFASDDVVSDVSIRTVLSKVLDTEHPREFYWSLMDYGSFLKSQGIRTNSRIKGYKKQTALAGSIREVRGWIIRELSQKDYTVIQLQRALDSERDDRLEAAITGLIRDGLIIKTGNVLHLTK